MPPFRFVTYCAVPFRIKTAAAISAHPLFKRICTKTIDRNVYSFGKALCGALPIRAAPIRQSSSDRPLDLSYDCSYWNSRIESTLEQDACDLFAVIDTDADNRVSREEFVWGLTSAPNVDLFEIEAGRLFDSIDTEEAGFVDRSQFIMVKSISFDICKSYLFCLRRLL